MSNIKKREIPQNPRRLGIRNALRINTVSLPWQRALGSALATCLPVLFGVLFDQLIYGVTTSLGAFTFLYTSNESYNQRAKKIIFIALGLSLSMFLGTLLAPYTLYLSIAIGLIGFIAFYVMNGLKIVGPGAIFFVLMFAVGTGLPVDPPAALERGSFVLLGGLLSWVIAMSGWFFHRLQPERKAVVKVYEQIEGFIKSIGTDQFNNLQHTSVLALRQADSILAGPSNSSDSYKKLLLLNHMANDLLLSLTEISRNLNSRKQLQPYIEQITEIIRALKTDTKASIKIEQDKVINEFNDLQAELISVIDLLNNDAYHYDDPTPVSRTKVWSTLYSGLNKHSLILPNSLLYGITVFIATFFAYTSGFNRPYWIPVACAAVMLGANTTLTIHRAIQRSLGTLVGIAIGGAVLTFEPSGIAIFFLVGMFQFLVELIIVRNYVFANMFIAPLVLVIVETMNPGNSISYFTSARALDTIIGSIIGVLGVLFLWRDLSHKLVPKVLSETLLSISSLLGVLYEKENAAISKAEHRLLTNLINLRTVYDRTLGDYSRKQTNSESLWPAIMHTQHLGYLFITYSKKQRSLHFSKEEYQQVKDLLQKLAQAIEQRDTPEKIRLDSSIPDAIVSELYALQEALKREKY